MKPRTRTDIQGLRAVAVILVILFHLPAAVSLRGGFVGVDMFYVISGFVVTNMVITATNTPGQTLRSVGVFLKRRVMRLVPALSVVVVATMILAIVFAPTQELNQVAKAGIASETFVSNFFYARNFDTYWNPAVLRSPFLHTWSLGVEFQTYLLFPLLFAAVFAARRAIWPALKSALVATTVLGIISLIAFVYLLVVAKDPIAGLNPQALAFYTPVTRFWEFALGIIPAIIVSRYAWEEKHGHLAVTVLGWVFISAGVVGCTVGNQLNLWVIAACVGVTLLLANGARGLDARRSVLDLPPLVWVGDRSYSVYLWHWPLLVLSLWLFPGNVPVALASVAVTVLLSMLTYRFIEQKFRRSPSKKTLRALVPSGVFVVAGVLAGVLGLGISTVGWYLTPTPLAAAATAFQDEGPTGADMNVAVSGCTIEELQITCVNNPGAATVVVIGDSLGYRSLPAVQFAAQQHGLNATMMWTGGCGIEVDSCPPFVYDYLNSTDVAAIIVAMNYDRASNRNNAVETAAGDVPECPADEPVINCKAHTDAVGLFSKRATPGLEQLDSISPNLLVALPFPQQQQAVDACLSPPLYQRVFEPSPDPVACGVTSVAWQVERQGLFPSAIRSVADANSAVTLWDPTDYLCTVTECPSVINSGERIMSDGIHWSWEASRFFFPVFDQFLDDTAP